MRITLEYKSRRSKHERYSTLIPDLSDGMTIEGLLQNLELKNAGLSIRTPNGAFSNQILYQGPLEDNGYYLLKLPQMGLNMDKFMRDHFPPTRGCITEPILD